MAKLKVKFVINQGRRGAPLMKLGQISEQAERFLTALAKDCELETRPGEWLAVNFENGSIIYDAEFQGETPAGSATIFSNKLEYLADYDPAEGGLNGTVSDSTALEYARIGALIDPDEVVGMGIYGARGGKPKMRTISYSRTAVIRRQIESHLPTYGAVQGIIHSWQKEATRPSFQIRELATRALIKVFYAPKFYGEVARAVQERSTMLIVAGAMQMDRLTKQIVELRADKIEQTGLLSAKDFEALCAEPHDIEIDLGEDTYLGDAA